MILSIPRNISRLLTVLTVIITSTPLTGCGSRLPVSGRIAVNDKPIVAGGVTFVPDKDKGNASTVDAYGKIKDNGTYELASGGHTGVEPGWYKVLIVANEPADPRDPYKKPPSLVNSRYTSAATSDLHLEVKPGGTYDLAPSGP